MLVLKRTGSAKKAGYIFIANQVAMSTANEWLNNFQLNVIEGLWTTVFLIFAFFVMGRKWGSFATVYFALIILTKPVDHLLGDIFLNYYVPPEQVPMQHPIFMLAPFSLMVFALYRIVITRDAAEKKIKIQQEEINKKNVELSVLSLVATKTNNSIVLFDPKGNIEWVNETFTSFSGHTLKSLFDAGLTTLFNISGNTEIHTIYNDCVSNKKPVVYEASHIGKSGERLWVINSLSPVVNEQGEITKLIIITSDITDRKNSEDIIKQKNKDILSSINYAKRIQLAVLPHDEVVYRNIPDLFILYKPKDIVSGDFYWFHEIENDGFILVCADCTGHGVPGAFMTVIGSSLLNQIIIENKVVQPSQILGDLDTLISFTLKQEGDHVNNVRDGMDISLLKVNRVKKEFIFSSAKRPAVFIRDKQLQEIKGSKLSMGGVREEEKNFEEVRMNYQEGDILYLFTDGFVDQFGGEKGKKFSSKQLRELLSEIHHLPMNEQKQKLEQNIESWKGKLEQVDDICVMGIRF